MAVERFLAQLWATIESRKAADPGVKSYTRELLAKPPRIRRKIMEEAYEVNEAHQALAAGHVVCIFAEGAISHALVIAALYWFELGSD